MEGKRANCRLNKVPELNLAEIGYFLSVQIDHYTST